MDLFKPLEIAFRRFLLLILRFFIRRGRELSKGIDFNRCKVLFVRQDRIGDVLISTPLLYVFKKHYPHAIVDFLLSSNNHFVLENEPLVRKRWVYKKNLSSAWSVVNAIRKEQYDFVIDLMDNPSTTSTLICALAGGRWNVGLSKHNNYVYDITVPLLSRRDTHIIDRLAKLLTVFQIDVEREDLRVHYVVSRRSQEFANHFFEGHNLTGQIVLGLNISPTDGVRFWGRQNFQDLIRRLSTEVPSVRILLLYQPSDVFHAKHIAEPFQNILISPETHSFDQFAAFVQKLGLLVTPDTSAVHLAAAFQIPSVVLYVQSNKDLRIWEPYGSESETLVTDIDDLTTIPSDHVFAAVKRLLERKNLMSGLPQKHLA